MFTLAKKALFSLGTNSRRHLTVLTGTSVRPVIPKREAIPLEETRVQEYDYLTAAEYRMLFGEQGVEEQKTPRLAQMSLEREGKVYHLFDASRMAMGDITQQAVRVLQGKHKPTYRRNTIN